MRIHFWNVIFSLFFAILLFYGVWYLVAARKIYYVPFLDLALLTLAIFRLVRLFSYDVITQFIRDWFVGARPNTFKHTLGALINCPWCTGLWFSFIVVFFYFATIYSIPIILILALAAVASVLQILSNLVGWSAQVKKLEARALEGSMHVPDSQSKCG